MPDDDLAPRATQAVTVRLPLALLRQCQAEATREQRSLNFILTRIIAAWYAQMPDPEGPRPPYDTRRFYLGEPCQDNPSHRYGETGKSLRRKGDSTCYGCHLAWRKQQRKEPR